MRARLVAVLAPPRRGSHHHAMKNYLDALAEQLAALPAPASGSVGEGLASGELDEHLRALLESTPGWHWQVSTMPTADQLQALGRFGAALTISCLHSGNDAMVARIRDLHSPVVWLIEPSAVTAQRARALGFSVLHSPEDTEDRWLFGHDIASYKATPDWLNAKHWANPEQWGQNRW